jgi:hypothetical protein
MIETHQMELLRQRIAERRQELAITNTAHKIMRDIDQHRVDIASVLGSFLLCR